MRLRFLISQEFRAFMREVAAKVDWVDDRSLLVGPEALVHECGRGGRIEGSDSYRFSYFANDGHGRWEIELSEQQIRDIAAGVLSEVDALELHPNTRNARGEPLLVWGEYDDDALRIRSPRDLAIALDGVQALGSIDPCMVRLWSAADEQVIAMLNGAECALYVVRSEHGYGTSIGDPTRTGTFELVDQDLGGLSIPWTHCVSWRVARPALIRFAELGAVGDDVLLDGTIPSQMLVLGDYDRDAELANRRKPTNEPALTSLPAKIPHGGWAKRLLGGLVELHLLELDTSIIESIISRAAILLLELGDEAQDSLDAAQRLAKELSRLRGIGALFATAGDLQIALRRTQYEPTMPVEMPFK